MTTPISPVTNSSGETFTIAEAAKLAGLTVGTVRDYVKRIGITTIDQILRRKEMIKSGSGAHAHETKFGMLTVSEIYKRHPFKDEISKPLLSGRLCRRGGMCPSLWWEKLHKESFLKRLIEEGIEIEVPQKKENYNGIEEVVPLAFKARTTHCIHDGMECINYSKCVDHRYDNGVHSPDYKKDGSCYVSKEHALHTNANHGGVISNPPTKAFGGFSV